MLLARLALPIDRDPSVPAYPVRCLLDPAPP